MAFPQFSKLPTEIQLQVWEECASSPSMHIFEVVCPSQTGFMVRADTEVLAAVPKPDSEREEDDERLRQGAYLDALDTEAFKPNRDSQGTSTSYQYDPSRYRFKEALATINKAAHGVLRRSKVLEGSNAIYLPARRRRISMPNSDVIMLRFRRCRRRETKPCKVLLDPNLVLPPVTSPIAELLEAQWSEPMAKTLHEARKIALDIGDARMLSFEEIVYLACTLQNELEVLYLIDHCIGRCGTCAKGKLRARDLQTRRDLWNDLNYQNEPAQARSGDAIDAVSKRYVEVSDLEALGWDEEHPSFNFARMMDEAIRSQQHGESRGRFEGVRVLAVEDEAIDGLQTGLKVKCCDGADASWVSPNANPDVQPERRLPMEGSKGFSVALEPRGTKPPLYV